MSFREVCNLLVVVGGGGEKHWRRRVFVNVTC